MPTHPAPAPPTAVRERARLLLCDWIGGSRSRTERLAGAVADGFTAVDPGTRRAGGPAPLAADRRTPSARLRIAELSEVDVRRLSEAVALVEGEAVAEGGALAGPLRFTMVFVWEAGAWRLAHLHASLPAEAAAGRADRRAADLEAALAELEATQARLVQREKMAALGQLTAGIAHEMMNPLNFVAGFAEVSRELVAELAVGPGPGERQAILDELTANAEKIEAHAHRASGVVRSMMDHARPGVGRRRPVDLAALVARSIERAAVGRRARDPEAETRVACDLPSLGLVSVVPEQIGHALVNLLDNAFDAVAGRGHGGPSVRVSAKRGGGGVEVRVEDDGPGMDEAVRAHAFEPFFTTKPPGAGTGLGLSLSYEVVVLGHGGAIDVESEPGRGTAVVVRLPLADAAVRQPHAP